jgi:RHS repeat-associated protein
VKIWSGAASYTDANAVEKWAFSFDNPLQPTVTQVTDPLGNVATYKYDRDTNSDKTRVTEIDGDCPSCGAGPQPKFYYDDANNPLRPTRMTDSRGTTTVFTYNSDGLLTEKTEAMGTPLERTTTLEYNGPVPALVTRVERPSTSGTGVQATVSSYDGVGNEISNTLSGIESGSAFNYSTVTTYNGAGEPLTVDPPGNGTSDVTSYTYDASRGNLLALTRTEPLIGQTGFSYDAFNRLTATVDPNAVSTETIFDLLDRATSIAQRGATPAEDLVTTRTYNAFGDLFRITLPLGNVVEYGYDGSGRLVSVERKPNAGSSGERAVFTLDGFGHHTHEELQRWSGSAWITDSTSDFVYSTRCHLDKAIHPDGSVTEYAYDCEGNPERVWDAKHPSANQTQPATQLNTYDLLNRVSSVTQPWGGSGGGTAITRYVFDAQDHATQVTDANGTVTSFTYSDRNLLTRSSSETSGITTYTFNEHGAQVSRTDARNVTVTQTFDALDRVVFVDYPENNLDMTYTYDDPAVPFSKDRLTAVTRNGQTTPYRYDRFGRILQDGGLTYSYDKNGNRQTLGYPGNVSAALTFDFADRPATLSMQDAAGPVQSLVSSSTHKAFGPLDSLALGNGLIESRGFTSRYFPSAISVPGRLDWTYTTDALGNVTAIADNLNGGGSRSFAYQDMQYFLTQGNGPWGTRTWTYGKSGDRLSETRDSVSRAYTYTPNAAGGNSSRLAQITGGASGTASFFSDPAGDITFHSEGTAKLRLTYDSDQQLAQQRAESDTTAQGLSQFTYDSRDFLSSSRLFSFAGSAAPDREVLATYDSQGTLHHREDLQHRSPSAPRNQPEIRDDGYIFYFAERPVAIYDKNLSTPVAGSPSLTTTLTYLTTDAVGAPILATDTAGTTRWQGGFEPFGADWNGAGASGLFLRLPGQWDDPAWKSTNLFYNLNRWYDSGTGRYTRPDPLPELSAVVPYSFALSNPMRYQDRNGLQALPKPLPPMVDPVPPLHLVPPPTTCVPEEAAAMGLGAMLSAGLTVILDELFFDPASAGEKGLDDLTDSRCKPKCGDCDPAEHRILQDAVDRICQSPRKCSAGMSPAQLQAYYTANVACYFARKEVNERCYRGGDAGHRQQQDDARRAALRCLDVMTGGKR